MWMVGGGMRMIRAIFVRIGHCKHCGRRCTTGRIWHASGLLLARNHEAVEIEFVHVTLAVHFGHDAFVVVVSIWFGAENRQNHGFGLNTCINNERFTQHVVTSIYTNIPFCNLLLLNLFLMEM